MKNRPNPWALGPRPEASTVRSADGRLAFRLQAVGEGVYVERMLTQPRRAKVMQAGVFRDPASFARWCDVDATRFSDPNLHHQLRQAISRLFDDDERRRT